VTPGMQVRLWFRRASPRQRGTTVAVVALIVLALIGSVAIAPDSGDNHRVATSGATNAAGDSSTATPDEGAGAAGGADATADAGAGGVTAGAASRTTATRGSQPGGGTGPGGSTPAGAAPGSVARIASDRGITASSVKVGFLPANVGGIAAAGYALNIRTDVSQYVQALADSVNKSGGVNGRKVDVAIRRTDPTSQSDQAAACEAMINDAKVFGIVDVGALADTPAMECVATRNKTPYVHNTIWDTTWLARSGGMEVGYQAAIDRISKTWARDLSAMGWLGKDAVVGILGDNCAATSPVIDRVLKPDFAKLPGVKKVVVAKHGCDLQSVVTQPGSFVTQFRAAGVTHVLVAAVFVAAGVFMSSAENQRWRPKYAVSDWWQATSDASAANYNPNQFDGAVGISSLGLMLPSSGKAAYPGGERCMKPATDAGLEPLKYDGRNQELWAMCDNFFLMLDALRNAGVNPTRQAWAQAVQRLGSHPSVMFGPSAFRAGKVTGSDQVHTLRWQRGCRCYKSVSGFRPAAA
jgi:ABC-type branched-subunit amino acid transport system substrate-binding protein